MGWSCESGLVVWDDVLMRRVSCSVACVWNAWHWHSLRVSVLEYAHHGRGWVWCIASDIWCMLVHLTDAARIWHFPSVFLFNSSIHFWAVLSFINFLGGVNKMQQSSLCVLIDVCTWCGVVLGYIGMIWWVVLKQMVISIFYDKKIVKKKFIFWFFEWIF